MRWRRWELGDDGQQEGLRRKKWSDCVMEDINWLGVHENVVKD